MRKNHGLLILFPILCSANVESQNSCENMLALLNRPTVADSVCVVKSGKILVELGAQYADLYPQSGHANTFPDSQLRFGLPASNELTILPPNYIYEYGFDRGFTATVIGLKHQFPDLGAFSTSAEGLLTLPTGSENFGSDGTGFALNGIINYDITQTFSVSLMLGVTTETASTSGGGERFNSFNPDLVFAWQCLDTLQLYAEFYGQTQTAPHQSSGFNSDAGIQYLITENIEIDLEYGQRLSGELGYFARYIGAGAGVRF